MPEGNVTVPPDSVSSGLSDLRVVLEFERAHEGRAPGKEIAIRSTFGVSATRYYQQLNRFIDLREALEVDAALTNRLLDARKRRADARAAMLGAVR